MSKATKERMVCGEAHNYRGDIVHHSEEAMKAGRECIVVRARGWLITLHPYSGNRAGLISTADQLPFLHLSPVQDPG